MSHSTARRIAAADGFKAKVDGIQRVMLARAVGRLTGGVGKAARELVKLLDSADEKVRLTAARAILADLVSFRDSTEILDRLAALEKRHEEAHVRWAPRQA